jgi:hypothetical protein
MNQQLLDKIEEIKQLATDARDYKFKPEDRMRDTFSNIIAICEQIEIDRQTKKRLENGQSDKVRPRNLV